MITGAARLDIGASSVLIHPTLPSNSWNFAVDLDASESELEETVRKVEAEFKKERRWPAWITGPYDRPEDLDERLKGLGYVLEPDRTVMWAEEKPEISGEAPEGLEIERADEGNVDECVQIAVQRFGWPREWAKSLRKAAVNGMARGKNHYRMFIAIQDGAGVGTAFLVFSAGTAGIYGMATSKDYEGRGIGSALLRHSTEEAFGRGIDVLTLQVATGSRAEAFYERAGFKKAYVARKFSKSSALRSKRLAEEETKAKEEE